jgi:hypothetical protein
MFSVVGGSVGGVRGLGSFSADSGLPVTLNDLIISSATGRKCS